jgi:hypothetical protein
MAFVAVSSRGLIIPQAIPSRNELLQNRIEVFRHQPATKVQKDPIRVGVPLVLIIPGGTQKVIPVTC